MGVLEGPVGMASGSYDSVAYDHCVTRKVQSGSGGSWTGRIKNGRTRSTR
jgi:hypothetical protein